MVLDQRILCWLLAVTVESYGVPAPSVNRYSTNLPEVWWHFCQCAVLMFSNSLWEKDKADKCSFLLLCTGGEETWCIQHLDIHRRWGQKVENLMISMQHSQGKTCLHSLKVSQKNAGWEQIYLKVGDRAKKKKKVNSPELAKQQLKCLGNPREHESVPGSAENHTGSIDTKKLPRLILENLQLLRRAAQQYRRLSSQRKTMHEMQLTDCRHSLSVNRKC